MFDVNGKTALVTGGSSGIGLGICRAFAEAGMNVAFTYRREDHLEIALSHLAEYTSVRILPVRLEVTDRLAFERVADDVEAQLGNIHCLCNNAGVNQFGPMDQATYADWDWMLSVNLGGVINGLKAVLPKIEAHGQPGRIINVASMSAFLASFESGIYTTTKFAIRGLTEALRYGLAFKGIGVSLVCPGLVQSNIHEATLSRPLQYSHTSFPVSPDQMSRIGQLMKLGADPLEVGRRVLQGAIRNDKYIFPTAIHAGELDELHGEVMTLVPTEEMESAIKAGDAGRRAARVRAEAAARALGNNFLSVPEELPRAVLK